MRNDSGAHPMRPDRGGADNGDMTVLAVHYDTRPGRFVRLRDGDQGSRRRARAARRDATNDLAREMKMQELRERIARNDYDVDPHAVADAIVLRLVGTSRPEPRGDEPRP